MEVASSSRVRIQQAAMKLFAETGASQINVSELAQAAGVARGTIYNNLPDTDHLFEQVAAQLGEEMDRRIQASFVNLDDPAARLARGIRLFIRRAHEEPLWGRFLCRFSFNSESLKALWTGNPMQDLVAGLQSRRYAIRESELLSVMAMVAGTTLSAIFLVQEGYKTWRQAGEDTVRLVLRAIRVPETEIERLVAAPLPPLPPAR